MITITKKTTTVISRRRDPINDVAAAVKDDVIPAKIITMTKPTTTTRFVVTIAMLVCILCINNNSFNDDNVHHPSSSYFMLAVSGFSLQSKQLQRPKTMKINHHHRFVTLLRVSDADQSGINEGKSAAAVIAEMAQEAAVENQKFVEDEDEDDEMDPYIECQYESYADGTKPDSSWMLAINNFKRQGWEIVKEGMQFVGLREKDEFSLPGSLNLKLSNEAVMVAEERRIAKGGAVDAHPVSQALYDVGCLLLDNLFDGRPIQRFWFLETIARIPYFSYVSMLHLYESLGWFRAVELRKVHSAEDWNELHHLLIMESLGGNKRWGDRFLGYHVAFLYYWFLILVYLGSPRIAYQFMELLEAHAVDTYTTFVRENRSQLRKLPPPSVAKSYYRYGDLYLFDDFQTTRKPGTRRPPCDSLLDVFENIAIDEGEHVKTMQACQDYAKFGNKVVSPHIKFPNEYEGDEDDDPDNSKFLENYKRRTNEYKRQKWKEWSDMINENNMEENNEMEGMDTGSEMSPF